MSLVAGVTAASIYSMQFLHVHTGFYKLFVSLRRIGYSGVPRLWQR
jgi:hypothetical protein